MSVSIYFDGSGKSNDPKCQWLVLAAVSATDSLWDTFILEWNKALATHNCSKLHMTDAMSRKGEFSQEKGWDWQKVDALLTDLLNVIGRSDRSNFHTYTVAVSLEDYHRAKSEIPTLISPDAIIMKGTFKGLHLQQGETDKLRNVRLLFDENEGFRHTIEREYRRARFKPGWPSQIAEIARAKRGDIGLQVADFAAWAIYQHYTRGDERIVWLDFEMAIGMVYYHECYDYDKIMKRYKEQPS